MNKYGDILIDYQDCTSPVKMKDLYEIADTVSEIIELAMIND